MKRKNMEITAKMFEDLSTEELYEILQARAKVFVVEQNCVYQDMDGLDDRAIHVTGRENGNLSAYLRIFRVQGEPGVFQIGRVLTLRRGAGLGTELLQAAISLCRDMLHAKEIRLESQCYCERFYEISGFSACSEPFIDDGIPHIWMKLSL